MLLCLAVNSRSLVSLQSSISQRSSVRVVEGALSLLDLAQPAAILTSTSFEKAHIPYPVLLFLLQLAFSFVELFFEIQEDRAESAWELIDASATNVLIASHIACHMVSRDPQILSLILEKREDSVIHSVSKVMADWYLVLYHCATP